jgi:hypothetical protein
LRIDVQLLRLRSWTCGVSIHEAKEAAAQPGDRKLLDERVTYKRRVDILANPRQTKLQMTYSPTLARGDTRLPTDPGGGNLVRRIVVEALVEPPQQLMRKYPLKHCHTMLPPA